MRRILVLLVLFGIIFGVQTLQSQTGGTRDPLTLASIGFVLLASFTLAELGGALSLPRVTGYLLAGVALGPSLANVLSKSVVTDMRLFNTLALGLIAVGAGLELDLRQLSKTFATLFSTILVKIVLGVSLVAGTFWLLETSFSWFGLTRAELKSVALIVGVLSIGTSPSITWAVTSETRAKGRLLDLVLGAAVLKDLVGVVALAIALALSQRWLGLGSGTGEGVLALVLKELGSSLLAGGILGVLLILYIRFVRAEILLFVAAMILAVSEIGRTLHLDLLLVFIAAGFVVRNFSRREHELRPAVQMVALPVFVVFFTIAGASIDLRVAWQVLPLAFGLASARAVSYVIASRIGGAVGGETPLIRGRAWLGYLPQAGITLGLLGLACRQLPELAHVLQPLGMAVIAVNLFIGPSTLKRVLHAAGEIPQAAPETPLNVEPVAAPAQPPPTNEAETKLAAILARVESVELRAELAALHSALQERLEAFQERRLRTWASELASTVAALPSTDSVVVPHAGASPLAAPRTDTSATTNLALAASSVEAPPDNNLSELERWAAIAPGLALTEHVAHCRELFLDCQKHLLALPAQRSVALEDFNRKLQPSDTFGVRWRKRRQALGRALLFERHPQRIVPVQLAARLAFEGRLALLGGAALATFGRAQTAVIEQVGRTLDTDVSAREAAVRAKLDEQLAAFQEEARSTLLRASEELCGLLRVAGGAALPTRALRFSQVEPEIRAALAGLATASESWTRALVAAQAALRARFKLRRLQQRMASVLAATIIEPTESGLDAVRRVLTHSHATLSGFADQVAAWARLEPAERASLPALCRQAFSDEAEQQLENAAARLRNAASVHGVALELRKAVEQLPESVSIPRLDASLQPVAWPQLLLLETLPLRKRVAQILIEGLLPTLDSQIREALASVSVTGPRIRESVDVCIHALESAPQVLDAQAVESVHKAFERGLRRLAEQSTALEQVRQRATTGIDEQTHAAFAELEATAAHGTARPAAAEARSLRRQLTRLLSPAVERAQGLVRRAREAWTTLAGSELSRDVQLRFRRDDVDAAEIRDAMTRWSSIDSVPADYARLFSREPVREQRLFTANREALAQALEAERRWLTERTGSALVVGQAGSGRTSLLNLCELELTAPRVIRPDPLQWRRSIGVEQALAIELGLAERGRRLQTALSETRTTVLLDDLEQWFRPDLAGLVELGRFLELVVASSSQVFWLVTIDQGALSSLEEVLPVRPAFGRIVTLAALEPEAIAAAIEGRHGLSGRKIQYPSTWLSRSLSHLRWSDDRDVYYRVLAKLSRGNLGAALAAWLRSLRFDADGDVEPQLQLSLTAAVALVAHLPPRQLAALAELARFGPLREQELAALLHLPLGETARHAHFLVAAGVLQREAAGHLRIAAHVQPIVYDALDQVGITRWI